LLPINFFVFVIFFVLLLFLSVAQPTSTSTHSTTMSWDAYVNDQLIATGGVVGGAIIGLDGGQWAAKGVTLKAGEGAGLAALFKNPPDAFAKGIIINGLKYLCIKSDDKSIYGKKGATGVATAKTGQAIIIGYYDEKGQPGNAAKVVEALAEYLSSNGY